MNSDKLWGKDENGKEYPFSVLCKPYYYDKDMQMNYPNPFFFYAMKRLMASERVNDINIYDQTITCLIDMFDNDEFSRYYGWNIPYFFLFRTVLDKNWTKENQQDLKNRLERRLKIGKAISKEWLNFYWFLNYSDKEKMKLAELLGPMARKADPLNSDGFCEWRALIILCDTGDAKAFAHLEEILLSMDYTYMNAYKLRSSLPVLTLLRRKDVIELLIKLMEREDILDKPHSYLVKEGSLAHTSALCLSVMLEGMPTIYKEDTAMENDDFIFPKEKRNELLKWLKKQKEFHFKPYNYISTKNQHGDFEDESEFNETLSQIVYSIFGIYND